VQCCRGEEKPNTVSHGSGPSPRPDRLLTRPEKRINVLHRVKLGGFEIVISELEVERNYLLRARRYLEQGQAANRGLHA
jgi:hypothetical protein